MRINSILLSSLGRVYPQDRTLPLTGSSHAVQPVLGLSGGIRNGGTVGAGSLSCELLVRADTPHAARLVLDEIIRLCAVGSEAPITVSFEDIPDREWEGHFDQNAKQKSLGTWSRKGLNATLVFSLPDPRARARTETVHMPLSGEDVQLVLGNAPSEARIEVASVGLGETVEVLVLDDAMQTLSRLAWTNEEGDAGSLVIDAAGSVLTIGGVSAVDDRMDPTSVFPVLYPADKASFIRVTGGNGITITYRKHWFS